MSKIKQIKEWLRLVSVSSDASERVGKLLMRNGTVTDTIFHERIQETKGFFRPQVTDFIVPKDWGCKDPCTVTVFRNASDGLWDDLIINLGTDEDVKTFYCPHFDENTPCTQECKYRSQNNEYFALQKQIKEAKAERAKILQERANAWHQIFARKSK